jgi:hypothetical protein
MLTIPPSALTKALKGKWGWGGGGPPANHELSHQDTNTHFFIIIDNILKDFGFFLRIFLKVIFWHGEKYLSFHNFIFSLKYFLM